MAPTAWIGIGIVSGIVLTLVGGIGWAVWMLRQQYRVVDDYRNMIERHERLTRKGLSRHPMSGGGGGDRLGSGGGGVNVEFVAFGPDGLRRVDHGSGKR